MHNLIARQKLLTNVHRVQGLNNGCLRSCDNKQKIIPQQKCGRDGLALDENREFNRD